MRSRALALTLSFLLLSLPAPARAVDDAPVAEGPDADGAYLLRYPLTRDHEGAVQVALDVAREDADGIARETRTAGTVTLPAGTFWHDVSFLPTLGDGDYAVTLLLDAAPHGVARFTVAGTDGASSAFSYQVPDEPTRLTLTTDTVNADGKTKSPGEALVTRVVLEDDNSLADVDAMRGFVERHVDGAWAAFDAFEMDKGNASATRAALEHRYTRSPIPAGEHRLTLAAVKGGAVVANVSRTFVIRDVAPVMFDATLGSVVPDEDVTVATTLVVGDRNGFTASTVEARLYKGSQRVESENLSVSLADAGPVVSWSAGAMLDEADGYARLAFPLVLSVPARAAPGTYRASIYSDGTLLGSIPFDVKPLPTLAHVAANATDATLRLDVEGTGDGFVEVVLDDSQGASHDARVALVGGRASIEVAAPSATPELRWTLRLTARPDGPIVDTREGWWNRSSLSAVLVADPLRVGGRLPATWTLGAPGWDLSGATVDVAFHRWDGEPEPALAATWHDGRLRIDGPPTLSPGRYQATARVTLANGSAGVFAWEFEAGPWLRLELSESTVSGREARIPVRNGGGVTIARFVVDVEGPENTTVLWDEGAGPVHLEARGARRLATGVDLAPGESGTLVVRLPSGPLPSGAVATRVRVLALSGGA